ncbi:uncharacterized protein LOC106013378 [Aplysia californica]|uniref:Uncharacterized protein LOC106013378 n=1 Tax=Aplysia californica TaxID=6500 RepID=A0ABM1AB89_APLCA|nr:uncharacterized protein LOC106013378 [Aplysia californica]
MKNCQKSRSCHRAQNTSRLGKPSRCVPDRQTAPVVCAGTPRGRSAPRVLHNQGQGQGQGEGEGHGQNQSQGQDYCFRYDDGLSARLGAKRNPLLLRRIGAGEDFHFKHPHSPCEERPSRVLPAQPYSWRPPVCLLYNHPPKPAGRPRYLGLYSDLGPCPPNETVIKHF